MRRALCTTMLAVLWLFAVRAAAGEPGDAVAEPTLPEVVVRPETGPTEGMLPTYPQQGVFGPGISWSSGQITSDTQLVGPYRQPVWTTQRPFTTTRVYVLPAGQMEIEQWVRPTWERDGSRKFRFLEEYEVGLPGRFQLDLYERWNVEPDDLGREVANHEGVQIELRWAVADWGRLPLNPTFYLEWVEKGGPQDKPDVYEIKLLLGDEILPNVYYGSNIVFEQEIAGDREQEITWSNAFATTVIERKLLAGVEMELSGNTLEGPGSGTAISFKIGPSVQWRLTNRIYVDVVGLFGTTPDSPKAQMYVMAGYQFGARAGPSGIAPVSTAAR